MSIVNLVSIRHDNEKRQKDNPVLIKFAGYIPKDLVLRFKQYSLVREKEQSELLEEAIAWWLDKEEYE